MIRSLPNILTKAAGGHVAAPIVRRARVNVARSTAASADFKSVLHASVAPVVIAPAAATAAPTVTPTPVATVNPLGLFTANPNAKPAAVTPDPAPVPAASYTPLPASQQALLNQPWDPFNKGQHEAKMNSWLIQETQNENNQKLELYQHAVSDWKVNDARARDLGIASPPPPTPPVLQAVGPMPDGYWFGKNA